jgi:NAD(P)-dependent dehydrogenase (short-subunit alcohol dehydrogenase family)
VDQLRDRVAVVTGLGSGIGLATARALAGEGMRLVIADVDQGRLAGAERELRVTGHEVLAIPTDVSSPADVRALADCAYDRFGVVHLVHLNVGIASGAGLFDDDTAGWEKAVGVNLLSVVWGIKAFVARMIAGGEDGLVMATSSGAGAEGTSYGSGAYAATKMAVVSLMESLYGQLRDRDAKVRAAILFPPLTATNLAGNPDIMKLVEAHLQSNGVPTKLVSPEAVAAMAVDGIKRGRFFIRAGERENDEFFDGALSDDYFAWLERVTRGRAEAQLSDGKPDAYLW